MNNTGSKYHFEFASVLFHLFLFANSLFIALQMDNDTIEFSNETKQKSGTERTREREMLN